MINSLYIITRHEIISTLRQAHAWLTPLLFFIIVVCLFPLSMSADEVILEKVAPGIIWVTALLAIVMSMGNLFKNDEGNLELYLLSSSPLGLLVLCKLFSHWLLYCFPLILISPVLALFLHMSTHSEIILLVTLFLGTPTLCLLGSIGAALTVGLKNHGLLLPILIMPLYIPVLIFGVGTVLTAAANMPVAGYLAIMGALIFISLAFAPLFTALALRIGVNQ